MAKITILFGAILIALGIFGYAGGGGTSAAEAPDDSTEQAADAADSSTGKKSVTALIPTFFGAVLVLCGVVALNESLLKHAMHAAAAVGLLGTLAGAGRGAMGLGKFFAGDPSLNQRSFLFVWLMALICGVFVGLCVRSFIAARRKREQEQGTAAG